MNSTLMRRTKNNEDDKMKFVEERMRNSGKLKIMCISSLNCSARYSTDELNEYLVTYERTQATLSWFNLACALCNGGKTYNFEDLFERLSRSFCVKYLVRISARRKKAV